MLLFLIPFSNQGQSVIELAPILEGPFFNTLPKVEIDTGVDTSTFRIAFKQVDTSVSHYALFISDAEVQSLEIGEKKFYTGRYQNIKQLTRKWDSRHFIVPASDLLGSIGIYEGHNLTTFSIHTAPAIFPAETADKKIIDLIAHSKLGLFFTIFFLGGVFIFLTYIIGLYVQTKNHDFKYYAYYLGAILLHNSIQADAYLKVYALFPRNPIWYHHLNEFFQMFIYAFFMLFIKVFLEIDKENPRLNSFIRRSIQVTIGFAFVFLSTALFTKNFAFIQDYLSVLWLIVAALGTIIVVWIYRKFDTPIRYYLMAGSIFLLIGSILELVSSLNLKGGYNWNIYIEAPLGWSPFNYTQLAILCETVCFALGIGYKIRSQEGKFLDLQLKEIDELKVKEKNIDLEKQLLEKELTALRSQMNPHFLFNSLNSVNNYIMKENPQLASKYLVRFSQLMRTILNNSKQKFVSLQQELEAIRLYVELENLRFKDKFDYKIIVQESLSSNQVLIPPMLIQPYVENAIKHGLIPKESVGRLSLDISAERRVLKILVNDDGIGRAASENSKNAQEKQRKSHGMEITSNRIDLMNKIYDLDAVIKIIDKSKGTQVKLTLKLITDEANVISSHS